jgi:hypothetical protein
MFKKKLTSAKRQWINICGNKIMQRVTLIFPDTVSIADFILHHNVRNGLVDSIEQTLTASMFKEQINIACSDYGAINKEEFLYISQYEKPKEGN